MDLTNTKASSTAALLGNGYSLSLAVAAGQGVVQGASGGAYAIPVAGVTKTGLPTFLTGNFGSSETADNAGAGKYLSTGIGSITLTFAHAETALALLWGSIDEGNAIAFGNTTGDVLTGGQVQALTKGFVSNGYQGFGGSAYVTIESDTPFTSVTFSSTTPSFEIMGVAASDAAFVPSPVPLPASAPLFGAALVALGAIGYGVKRKTAASAA